MKLTGQHAHFMMDIASARSPTGVPVPYDKSKDGTAAELERLGLVDRHHVGIDKFGACLTPSGKVVFDAICKQFK